METVHSNNRTLPLSARLPGLAGLAVFVFVTVLVQTRLLAGLDSAVAFWMASLAPGPLLSISTAFSIAFSAELSLIWAVSAGLVLWRRGLGLWSMAPLAFLIVTPVEILMKLTIEQPGVPEELHRSVYYPLTTLDLTGSFPSGHAIRSGFLCAFAGVLACLQVCVTRFESASVPGAHMLLVCEPDCSPLFLTYRLAHVHACRATCIPTHPH